MSTLARMTYTHTMQELVIDHASASIVFLTLVTVDTTHASNPASRGNLRR